MKLKRINESVHNIDKKKLLTLWYEDENGNKYIPSHDETPSDIPIDDFPYQVSQFPTELKTTYLRCYDSRSEEVAEGSQTWPEDLVLAMANSGNYSLSESILIAASSCERCLNALCHKYGLDNGYPEGSEEWKKCGTVCDFCEELPQ